MGILALTWKHLIMYLIGSGLIYLAIKKKYEPSLLLPLGFGTIMVNIPFSGVLNQTISGVGVVTGAIEWLYNVGIGTSEIMPLLLFIGIGAMLDFTPLLSNPKMFTFGFIAQFGIVFAIIVAVLLGFNLADAASIGIIGAADGPTAILVSQIFKSNYIGPITVAAYSYMALVPILLPAAIKLTTTKKERQIQMKQSTKEISRTTKILFPIIVTFISGLIAPMSVALIGFLMFGNLLRECKVLDSLSETAQKVLTNLITLVLGLTVSFHMTAEAFINVETIIIITLGLIAFVVDAMAGVLSAKFINLFTKNKINPMIGAAGISAFPMASRVVQKLGQKEDNQNFLLMQAAGANVAGQIASVIAGGLILNIIPMLMK